MIARQWRARCPKEQKEAFIKYLYQTGVKDTSSTEGFKGAQIFTRDLEDKSEVTLISYWDELESIKAFAGVDIEVARLYPEDHKYELEPDTFVSHYEVVENSWESNI
ncbi:MAG: antibiotic biosynthesis monooxygenase [Campylobacteraceae bacterium]|nr:antibiotic biosynthesis monooxygenase [Campylobacteraceae bacterium]